jgi:hypothetical protein
MTERPNHEPEDARARERTDEAKRESGRPGGGEPTMDIHGSPPARAPDAAPADARTPEAQEADDETDKA